MTLLLVLLNVGPCVILLILYYNIYAHKNTYIFFRCSGVKGSITINGHERNLSQFRKLSCYIMQDNQLHANLSVEEAMHVASSLKLGSDISKDSKYQVVSHISYCYYYDLFP